MKRILATLIMSACFISSPAMAGEPLWQNIEAGMTVEEVRTLYPKADKGKSEIRLNAFIDLGDYCVASPFARFVDGKVDEVYIHGVCKPELIYAGLVEKYGQPSKVSSPEYAGPSIFGATTKTTSQWVRDGVSVTFVQERLGVLKAGEYDITYRSTGTLASSL